MPSRKQVNAVHFAGARPIAIELGRVACGVLRPRADITSDRDRVTCKNCQRTVWYLDSNRGKPDA